MRRWMMGSPASGVILFAASWVLPAAAQDGPATAPADAAGTQRVEVTPQGRVRMHVRELDVATVLQMLSIQSQRNIVASPDVSGSVTANLYNVTFEEAITAILATCDCAWVEQGNFIFVYTREQLAEIEASKIRPVSRVFRLKYTRAPDVMPLIKGLLSDKGIVAATPESKIGLGTSAEDAGGDSYSGDDALFVTDFPERVEAVAEAVAAIDVRPRQLIVEATILRAQLNENNALGIDFNILGGVDFQGLQATSPGVTDLATGELQAGDLQSSSMTFRTDFNDAVSNGGFTFGLIDDTVAVFIRALEQITDTTVLANPKIPTMNKQRGELIVGRRDGYLTTTVTETAAVQSVEFLETGTQLVFRPFIEEDDEVRMEIHAEDSTGGLTAANLPFEQTTETTTNIRVKDGNTILIGGLFREVTSASREQVPLLGNIPIVGSLVRSQADNTQREEVIILLTVHLIDDAESFVEASKQSLQDVEAYRAGMRESLQWFGRERLAQAHYKWAVEHLSKGKRGKALWDLNLAINNNPKLIAAIRLKEQLEDRQLWEDDGSAIRSFVAHEIMKDEGLVQPIFGRPGPPFGFPILHGGFEEDGGPPSEDGTQGRREEEAGGVKDDAVVQLESTP